MNGRLSEPKEATCKRYLQVHPASLVQLNAGPSHAGKLRSEVAEKLALERYDSFEAARCEAARLAADAEDMAALEQTERQLEGKRRGVKK